MPTDPIRGSTIRWTFRNGPLEGRTCEHRFAEDGTVTWCVIDGTRQSEQARYDLAEVGDDVYAVSYLGVSGWTLTCVLDFRTDRVVAFASNATQLVLQHGTFEVEEDD